MLQSTVVSARALLSSVLARGWFLFCSGSSRARLDSMNAASNRRKICLATATSPGR